MKFAWVGDRYGSSGNVIGQSPRPARCSWPASVNDTPSSPSPRISVSLARAACIAPPKNSVLRPAFGLAATAAAAAAAAGRGPTRVSTPSKVGGATMRDPQLGQNRLPGVTYWPHLVQVAPLPSPGGGGIGLLCVRGRGSRATAAPHRLHCGTPIGVSALHASQTRPTSIKAEILLSR